jgi:hypothetical protein
MSPCRGKRTGEDPSQILSCSDPWDPGNKERAGENVLFTIQHKHVREVFSPLLTEKKKGQFRIKGKDVFWEIGNGRTRKGVQKLRK